MMKESGMRGSSKLRSDYDSAADNYDKLRFGTPGGLFADSVEKMFVARVVIGLRVLEVGTASGRFAIFLANRGFEYTGVDISERMLRATSERIRGVGASASLLCMDAGRLGFRRYFQSVICVRTFHFLQNPLGALCSMAQTLEYDGRCLVTFETDNLLRRLFLKLGFVKSEQRYYKRAEVEDMFRESGLRVVRSGSVMRIPITMYRRCPEFLLGVLWKLEGVWSWAMHEYVLGEVEPNPRL